DRHEDGAVKLDLIRTVLTHRRENQALYGEGSYRPLEAQGELRAQVVSFLRRKQGLSVIVAAPRLVSKLMGDDSNRIPVGREAWGDTELVLPDQAAGSRWRNLLTDEMIEAKVTPERRSLELALAFQTVPLALLIAEEPDGGGSS